MADSGTHRLYYDDPYLRRFEAHVIARGERDGHAVVALDRTAFYPEGGGQPGDHGSLGEARVLDTYSEGELVWHVLDRRLDAEHVAGELDWSRRFDFMQQHHGQHLLSAAFEHLFDARTVSVHLGEELCTVDLQHPGLSPDHLTEAEELTNRTIYDNLPIDARFVTAEELSTLSLRKPPGAYERVRIVSAGDFDHSPCGGTHPRRTGEVGSVVLRRWERRGDVLRVEFICGMRALRDYRWKNAMLNGVAGDLSIATVELPAAIERLRDAEERARKALAAAEERLLRYEARELLETAARIGEVPVVVQTFDGRDLDNVRGLARLVADGGGIALFGIAGTKAQLVFARAAGLPDDMGKLLREAAAIVGGRGGGRPEAAQGGGPDVEKLAEALELARRGVMRDE